MNNYLDIHPFVKHLSEMDSYGIHWFRRDLRVTGNKALQYNWKRHKGCVVGVFCFDKEFLSRPDFSVNRFQFFLDTLSELKKELNELGSDLLFLDVGPEQAFPELFKNLKTKPNLISWGKDYEPFARERDNKVRELFQKSNIKTLALRDHLLIEPEELSKPNGESYQVYSPFARKWLELFDQSEIKKRVRGQSKSIEYLKEREGGSAKKLFNLSWPELLNRNLSTDNLKKYSKENGQQVTVPVPKAGSLQAFKFLKKFSHNLERHKESRDIPMDDATSRLSMYLKNGSLTVPQIISFLKLESYKKKKTAYDLFFSQLIWREFYYHILYHHPFVESRAFLEKYRNIQWENNEEYFDKWKHGMTGFPIIDAGMRQLMQTGWMHNRVRMIVASFLTKDLLIDWRWGEAHFMHLLLDGDLALNNGGWQWAASTGCDPQPYFRIFNPWLQSKKFDPEGEYIKKYVKELKDVKPKLLHQPYKHNNYPEPIVDHFDQRDKALKLYKV